MNTFNTGGWDWGHSDYSEAAVGDSGPWIWWLPLAWRAVSDPGGPHPLPPPPGPADWGEGEHPSEHPETLAWWTPLFHLLLFGLGWVRPDLGLARWIEHGRPDQDPVLRVVNRWWGENVTDVLAWSARNDVLRDMAAAAAGEDGGTLFPCELPDRWAERRRSLEWRRVWGTDNDSMHLGGHGITPVWGTRASAISACDSSRWKIGRGPCPALVRRLVRDFARGGIAPPVPRRWPVLAGQRGSRATGVTWRLPALPPNRTMVLPPPSLASAWRGSATPMMKGLHHGPATRVRTHAETASAR
jgi:hypothetical protein